MKTDIFYFYAFLFSFQDTVWLSTWLFSGLQQLAVKCKVMKFMRMLPSENY